MVRPVDSTNAGPVGDPAFETLLRRVGATGRRRPSSRIAVDAAAQDAQGDDRDDRDQREDQRVLGEPLALLVAIERGEDLE